MTMFGSQWFANAGGSTAYEVDNSIKFNDDDTEYLTLTPSGSATSRRKFTMSAWVKRGNLGTNFPIFSARSGANSDDALNFTTGDKLEVMVDYTNDGQLTTNALFRDPHAWYHIVLAVDTEHNDANAADRLKLYVNNVRITSFSTASYPDEDYDFERWQVSGNENTIGRTLSVAAGKADGYMAEVVWIDGEQLTPSSFGETDSNGVWRPVDVTGLTFGNYGYYLPFTNSAGLGQDYSGNTAVNTLVQKNTYSAGSEINNGDAGADPSTGMKFVPIASGTVAKIELRASSTGFSGVTVRLETDGGSGNAPSGTLVPNGSVSGITSSGAGLKTATFSTPPSVTAGTTYWIVLRGDTGTWGWQHDVSGSGGALGLYQGGQGYFSGRGVGHYVYMTGNQLTPTNSPTQSTDTCTSNAATLSPLWTDTTLSNGNLKTVATTTAYQWAISTIAIPSSGKWTCEFQSSNINGSSLYGYIGIAQMGNHTATSGTSNKYGINLGTGELVGPSGTVHNFSTASYATTLMRLEYDASADTIKIFSAGSEIFPASTGASATVGLTGQNSLHFWCAPWGSGADFTATFKGLSGTPTTDYKELTTTNILENSTPTVEDGSAHHQATLYEGNNGSQSITQDGTTGQQADNVAKNSTFKPDLLWTKKVGTGTGGHAWFDIVRTTSSGQFIRSDDNIAEDDEAGFATFDVKGFSWDGAGTEIDINVSSKDYVAWQWLADNTVGGSTSGFTQGSLTSTVSKNQTAGFSIVKWTGNGGDGGAQTIGHGLGAIPKTLFVKNLSTTDNWVVYHTNVGFNALTLNTTAQRITTGASVYWNDTPFNSTVFTVNTHAGVNGDGNSMIAYCFADVPGFSKFGGYEGNNAADGQYIELGFKPALFIAKNYDATGAWLMFDSAREPFNLMDLPLEADDTKAAATSSGRELDFLSNGVKLRGNSSYLNSGHSFAYWAWAEHPFAGTTPSTAY